MIPLTKKVTLLLLRKLGFIAEAVDNGLEVIQVLEKRFYDIVLMDIQMPKMNGIEATRIIRTRWPQGPKIIFITDCDSTIYRKRCFEAGADQFLAKPVSMEKLTAAIEHDMPRRLQNWIWLNLRLLGFPHSSLLDNPVLFSRSIQRTPLPGPSGRGRCSRGSYAS